MNATVELMYCNRFVFYKYNITNYIYKYNMTNISGLLKIRILIVRVSQMAR